MTASPAEHALHLHRKERLTYYVGELDYSLSDAATAMGMSRAGVSTLWKEVKNDLGRQAWL